MRGIERVTAAEVKTQNGQSDFAISISINAKKPRTVKTVRGFFNIKKSEESNSTDSYPCRTIGAEEINFRVRNGNGWILFAMTTDKNRCIEVEVSTSIKKSDNRIVEYSVAL